MSGTANTDEERQMKNFFWIIKNYFRISIYPCMERLPPYAVFKMFASHQTFCSLAPTSRSTDKKENLVRWCIFWVSTWGREEKPGKGRWDVCKLCFWWFVLVYSFFMALQRQLANVECYNEKWEMKKRSHLHHNRNFFTVIIYGEYFASDAAVVVLLCEVEPLSLSVFCGSQNIFLLLSFFRFVYILCIPRSDFTSQCIIWQMCVLLLSVEMWKRGLLLMGEFSSLAVFRWKIKHSTNKTIPHAFCSSTFSNWYSIWARDSGFCCCLCFLP